MSGQAVREPQQDSHSILNLFSPKRDLFDGQCHIKSTLFPQEFVFHGIVLGTGEGCNAFRLHCRVVQFNLSAVICRLAMRLLLLSLGQFSDTQ